MRAGQTGSDPTGASTASTHTVTETVPQTIHALVAAARQRLRDAGIAGAEADFDARLFDDGDGCPGYAVLAESPLRVQYDGGDGCTAASGVTYAGTADATNPASFDMEPDGGAMGTTFDGFLVADDYGSAELDGSRERPATAARLGSGSTRTGCGDDHRVAGAAAGPAADGAQVDDEGQAAGGDSSLAAAAAEGRRSV